MDNTNSGCDERTRKLYACVEECLKQLDNPEVIFINNGLGNIVDNVNQKIHKLGEGGCTPGFAEGTTKILLKAMGYREGRAPDDRGIYCDAYILDK